MRWRRIPATVIALAMLAASAAGQGPSDDCLIHVKQCGTFRIVLGRLLLDRSIRYRSDGARPTSSVSGDVRQSVRVTTAGGSPSLFYERTAPDHRVTIDVRDARRVQIVIDQGGDSPGSARLVINQPHAGPLHYEYRTAGAARRGAVRSLWHLAAVERQAFAEHLAPVLQMLLGPLPVAPITDAVDATLRAECRGPAEPLRAEVRERVERLAGDRRRDRLAAERQLQAMGLGVLPLLDEIDRGRLDPEQRARIARVRRNLTPRRHDTPERLAVWLSADPSYWNAVSRHWPRDDRQAADRRLRIVCGTGLAPDVLAAESRPSAEAHVAETPRTVR